MSPQPFKSRWEVKKRVEEIADEAAIAAGSAPYVVYTFIDPARIDPSGRCAGLPLYVG